MSPRLYVTRRPGRSSGTQPYRAANRRKASRNDKLADRDADVVECCKGTFFDCSAHSLPNQTESAHLHSGRRQLPLLGLARYRATIFAVRAAPPRSSANVTVEPGWWFWSTKLAPCGSMPWSDWPSIVTR